VLPILIVVIAFIAGCVNQNTYMHDVDVLSKQYLWALADNLAKDIDTKFARATDTIDSMANAITLSTTGKTDRDEELIYQYLENMAKANSDILAFYIIWDEPKYAQGVFQDYGQITRMTMSDAVFASDWYTNPLSTGKHYITPEPREADYDGEQYIFMTLSRPFVVNGKTAGVVSVDIALDYIVRPVWHARVYDTGYAMLLSPTQVYLTHPNRNLIGQKYELTQKEVAHFNNKEIFTKVETSKATGITRDVFFTPIVLTRTATFFYVAVNVPRHERLVNVKN
jgi:hypothetical protein